VFYSTGSLVRAEAIITSLVFEHSLRARTQAALPETKPGVDVGTLTGGGKKGMRDTKDSSLAGKISSHVTTDLNNITNARDFLVLRMSIVYNTLLPAHRHNSAERPHRLHAGNVLLIFDPGMEVRPQKYQLSPCLNTFNSSLVGLAVIIITLPIPGKLGTFTRIYQKKKMAAVTIYLVFLVRTHCTRF
jgi:hypothetical protein